MQGSLAHLVGDLCWAKVYAVLVMIRWVGCLCGSSVMVYLVFVMIFRVGGGVSQGGVAHLVGDPSGSVRVCWVGDYVLGR